MNVKELTRYGSIIRYEKGQIVRFQGDPIDEVLILLEGSLCTEHLSERGKILGIEDLRPPSVIASALIFSKDPRYPVTVFAKERSKVLKIPKEEFLDILMKRKDLMSFFLEEISERFKMVSERLFSLTTKTLREKLLHYLIQNADENKEVSLNMSVEDLSKMFGCTRPALSRVFKELVKEGLIEKRGRKVRILSYPP